MVGRDASGDAEGIDQFEDEKPREGPTKIGYTNARIVRAGTERSPGQKDDLRCQECHICAPYRGVGYLRVESADSHEHDRARKGGEDM